MIPNDAKIYHKMRPGPESYYMILKASHDGYLLGDENGGISVSVAPVLDMRIRSSLRGKRIIFRVRSNGVTGVIVDSTDDIYDIDSRAYIRGG